jgi:hypothetical protein
MTRTVSTMRGSSAARSPKRTSARVGGSAFQVVEAMGGKNFSGTWGRPALRMGWTGRAPALSSRASKHEEYAAMSQSTNAVAIRTIGIDTGKNTFHLIGLDEQGTIVLREKLARGRIVRRLANSSPCLIGIEAGMATHYVARELLA